MLENNPPAIDLASNIKCSVIEFYGNENENPSPKDVDYNSKALTAGELNMSFIVTTMQDMRFSFSTWKKDIVKLLVRMPGQKF